MDMRWYQTDWRTPIWPGSNQKRSEENMECGSCKSVTKMITSFILVKSETVFKILLHAGTWIIDTDESFWCLERSLLVASLVDTNGKPSSNDDDSGGRKNVRIPQLRSISPFQTIWFSEFNPRNISSHKHHEVIENIEIDSTGILTTQRELQEYHSNKLLNQKRFFKMWCFC